MNGKRFVKIIAMCSVIAVLCAVIIISYKILTGHYQNSKSGSQATYAQQQGVQTAEDAMRRYSEPTNELMSRGKKLYLSHCASCHGENGEGNGPRAWRLKPKPRDYRDKNAFKNGTSVATLIETLDRGVAGSAMPSFRVMPIEDRYALAHYIRTFMPNPEVSLNRNEQSNPEADSLEQHALQE